MDDPAPSPRCEDCGLPYVEFPLDTVLPDDDWRRLHPSGDGGLLCAGCIAARAAALPGVIVLHARLVFDVDHDVFRSAKDATWREIAGRIPPRDPTLDRNYYAQAVRLVCDELETLKPEELHERCAKMVAILRHAARAFAIHP